MSDRIIELFYYACAAYGVIATLYYLVEANWWRVEFYLEGRRIDRLIRRKK